MRDSLPVGLTIAGSDSGGCAGIQADLLTFAALGVFGTTALTCLTAQNPRAVSAVVPLNADFVTHQIQQVATYFEVRALKTGMLFTHSIIEGVAHFIKAHPHVKAVVDPVMVASSGAPLLERSGIAALKKQLLPCATLLTPNLDEAALLLDHSLETFADLRDAASTLAQTYGTAVLVKGGHLDGAQLSDILASPDGSILEILTCRRIHGIDTHGSGCTLSAAITAELAKGHSLIKAVQLGHAYLQRAFQQPLKLCGQSFLNHGVC